MTIAVLGATGKTGRHLVARLCGEGHRVIAIGRDRARFAAVDARAECRIAPMEDAAALTAALSGADRVVCAADASFARAVLSALPPSCVRVVLTGTLQRFRSPPTVPGRRAAEAESALAKSGRTGLVVHFGMIYGPPDDGNVERLVRFFRRLPRAFPIPVPLPHGGRAKVQPIHMDDVVAALVGALFLAEAPGAPLVAAGPPIAYADMVRATARATGRSAWIVPIPRAALLAAVQVGTRLGLNLPAAPEELARVGMDKPHSLADMAHRLGVVPRAFPEGLARKLAQTTSEAPA